VGGHIAGPEAPLGARIGKYEAILTGGKIFDFLAAFTLHCNRITGAAIVLTAFFGQKSALMTFLDACTNHCNHILPIRFLRIGKRVYMPEKCSIVKEIFVMCEM
jgi:hypothetical protein